MFCRRGCQLAIWRSYARSTAVVSLTFLSSANCASAFAQGGGNATSVGVSIEAAANSAAASSGTSGAPSAPQGGFGPPAGFVPPGPPPGFGPPAGFVPPGPPSGFGPPAGFVPPGPPPGFGGPTASAQPSPGNGGVPGTSIVPTSNGERAQVAMISASQMVSRGIAGFFNAPSATQEESQKGLSLWEQAALAFYQGDPKKSLALYHSHIVCSEDESAETARGAIQFSRLLKRPVWCIRFGISMHPRVPDTMTEDPQPIREGMRTAAAPVRGRGMAGRMPPGRPPEGFNPGIPAPPGDPRMNGNSNLGIPAPPGDPRMNGNSNFGGPAVAAVVINSFGGPETDRVTKLIDKNLGVVADVVKDLFSSRQTTSNFGRAFDSMEAAGAKLASQRPDLANQAPSGLPMWIPGVEFVGEGPSSTMLAVAKKNEIDFLMHFDIIVKESRVGTPSYTTRCQIFQVDNSKVIGISKAVDKDEITSKTTGIRESVQEQFTTLFDILDKQVTAEPMPALQAPQASARIDALLASKKPHSMRNLAEIMMFKSRDLITPQQLDQAFFYAGGEDALRLLHDLEPQRNELANTLVQRELTVELEAGDK